MVNKFSLNVSINYIKLTNSKPNKVVIIVLPIFIVCFIGMILMNNLDYTVIINNGNERILYSTFRVISFLIPAIPIFLILKSLKLTTKPVKPLNLILSLISSVIVYCFFLFVSILFFLSGINRIIDLYTISKNKTEHFENTVLIRTREYNNHGKKFEFTANLKAAKKNISFFD